MAAASKAPHFWIIAGPNGAGKSTIVKTHRRSLRHLIHGVPFINPDERAKQKLIKLGCDGFQDASLPMQREAFIQAAVEVAAEIEDIIKSGGAIGVETVLSTDKYRSIVSGVERAGGTFGIIYVALSSPRIACERVARRVAEGGHAVPKNKIHERWHRSLNNVAWFLEHATYSYVFDNSNSDPAVPPKLVAQGWKGKWLQRPAETFPELAVALKQARMRLQ